MFTKGCAILLLGLSQHFNASVDYNEVHPTVGVECESWSAGVYENSDAFTDNYSAWASKRWTYTNNLFLEAGIVVGYEEQPVLPLVRIGYDMQYAEAFIAPGYDTYANRPMVLAAVQFKLPVGP